MHVPRPLAGELHGKALERPSDARYGDWTRLELIEMDERFARAMARAPEAPKGDGPDRIAASLLSLRGPC